MITKAKRTTAFIIETVAPIFIKKGYVGTSMSDLTKATGLTKGAIYGNFKDKEALALAAYGYSCKKLLDKIDQVLSFKGSCLDKVHALTDFYRQYNIFTEDLGGCPILKIGVDARHNTPLLADANRETVKKIEGKIAKILENGSNNNEIKLPVTPLQFAKQLHTMVQGAVAMYTITDDTKYLTNTVAYLNLLIKKEIKK